MQAQHALLQQANAFRLLLVALMIREPFCCLLLALPECCMCESYTDIFLDEQVLVIHTYIGRHTLADS